MKESSSSDLRPKKSSQIIVKQKSHPKESMDEEISAIESDKDLM